MIDFRIKVKDTLGPWLGGLKRLLGRTADEASQEISAQALPEPRDEAEEALWQAMGWDEPQGDSAFQVAAGRFKEALGK